MSQLKNSKVSVCTPVYNGAEFIAESIESVLGQSFKNFELIICDNCSTDDTKKIVKQFTDPRIVYHRNEKNIGLVGNANKCLEIAKGDYVAIFHHDDVMLPENLEMKVKILSENRRVGFVYSNAYWIDHKGMILDEWLEDARRNFIEDGKDVFRRYMLRMHKGALIFIGSVLARKECYEKTGGFREDLPHTNDSEMWMKMLLFYNAACIGKPLVKWRQHGKTASFNWNHEFEWLEEHFRTTQIIFKEFGDRITDNNLEKKVDKLFFNESLKRGIEACWRDQYEIGRSYFAFANTFKNISRLKKSYFELALRKSLGKKKTDKLRMIKNKLLLRD